MFASFTILRHRPHVLVCLRGHIQYARGDHGASATTREIETGAAMGILGATWEQLPFSDQEPDYEALEQVLRAYADDPTYDGTVFAPEPEPKGHDQHNEIGEIAIRVFGVERVERYLTYQRGSMRTRGRPVPFEPGWPALKLRAMACYLSQIRRDDCLPWFVDDSLREWYA